MTARIVTPWTPQPASLPAPPPRTAAPEPEPALFEVDAPVLRSEGQRRTYRQADGIPRGVHPPANVFGPGVRMHPDADRDATRTDRGARPLRCGSCMHRRTGTHGTAGTYPKCFAGDGARATRSAGTDVRGWWPACTDYDPVPS